MGLQRFIQLFIWVTHHMRSCFHSHPTLQFMLPIINSPSRTHGWVYVCGCSIHPCWALALLIQSVIFGLWSWQTYCIMAECPARPPCPMVRPIHGSLVFHSPLHTKVSVFFWLCVLNSISHVRFQFCCYQVRLFKIPCSITLSIQSKTGKTPEKDFTHHHMIPVKL